MNEKISLTSKNKTKWHNRNKQTNRQKVDIFNDKIWSNYNIFQWISKNNSCYFRVWELEDGYEFDHMTNLKKNTFYLIFDWLTTQIYLHLYIVNIESETRLVFDKYISVGYMGGKSTCKRKLGTYF